MAENQLTVRDLMTGPVVTVSMDDGLFQVQHIFQARRFHHLIVTEKDKPVGVLSDRDLLKNLSPFIGVRLTERAQDINTLKRRVHQIMTRKLISIAPDASAMEAARLMLRERVSCLPVIAPDGQLVGILTSRDLLRWLVTQQADLP